MEIVSIDKRAYEAIRNSLAAFFEQMEELTAKRGLEGEWLDSQEVCVLLDISKRTLQYYKQAGMVPHSMIGNKTYYRTSDIKKLLERSAGK